MTNESSGHSRDDVNHYCSLKLHIKQNEGLSIEASHQMIPRRQRPSIAIIVPGKSGRNESGLVMSNVPLQCVTEFKEFDSVKIPFSGVPPTCTIDLLMADQWLFLVSVWCTSTELRLNDRPAILDARYVAVERAFHYSMMGVGSTTPNPKPWINCTARSIA